MKKMLLLISLGVLLCSFAYSKTIYCPAFVTCEKVSDPQSCKLSSNQNEWVNVTDSYEKNQARTYVLVQVGPDGEPTPRIGCSYADQNQPWVNINFSSKRIDLSADRTLNPTINKWGNESEFGYLICPVINSVIIPENCPIRESSIRRK